MAGQIQLVTGAEPSTPAASTYGIYVDSADGLLKIKKPDGSIGLLSDIGRQDNLLLNAEFQYLRRQVAATLTTRSSTTAILYGADRWGGVNENASVQYAQVDTNGTAETGLAARFYLQWKKITSQGKMVLMQPLEIAHTFPLAGRKVRFSFKAKNSVGSHTLRLGLLYITTSGTVDQLPSTIASSFGAASTDPTWGTNLTALAPSKCSATGTAIVGNGVTCTLSSTWTQFSGVFTVPTGFKCLIPAIWTDDRPAANDIIFLSECLFNEGEDERVYIPRQPGLEMPLLQRYYQKSFDTAVAPAQSAGNGGKEAFLANVASGSITSPLIRFVVPPRTYLNLSAGGGRTTLYNPAAANAQLRNERTSTDCTSTVLTFTGEIGWHITATLPASSAIGDLLVIHWDISFEITELS